MLRIVGRTILIVIVAALIVGSVFVGIAGALSKSGGLVCHDSVGVNYFGISFPTRFVLYRSDPEIFPGKLSIRVSGTPPCGIVPTSPGSIDP